MQWFLLTMSVWEVAGQAILIEFKFNYLSDCCVRLIINKGSKGRNISNLKNIKVVELMNIK